MSDETFLETVWPWVDRANSMAESFSQISQAMTVLLSAETVFPQTDKGSAIRARTYQLFEQDIKAAYDRMKGADGPKSHYDLYQMCEFLLKVCREELNMPGLDLSSDLFRSGLDSLKATQLISHVRRHVELDTRLQSIGIQQIYQAKNLGALAEYLSDPTCVESMEKISLGQSGSHKYIQDLIDQYGAFETKLTSIEQPNPGRKILVSSGTFLSYARNEMLML